MIYSDAGSGNQSGFITPVHTISLRFVVCDTFYKSLKTVSDDAGSITNPGRYQVPQLTGVDDCTRIISQPAG